MSVNLQLHWVCTDIHFGLHHTLYMHAWWHFATLAQMLIHAKARPTPKRRINIVSQSEIISSEFLCDSMIITVRILSSQFPVDACRGMVLASVQLVSCATGFDAASDTDTAVLWALDNAVLDNTRNNRHEAIGQDTPSSPKRRSLRSRKKEDTQTAPVSPPHNCSLSGNSGVRLHSKASAPLKEVNLAAAKQDAVLAAAIAHGDIDGVIAISCAPHGVNSRALRAAADAQVPVVGAIIIYRPFSHDYISYTTSLSK